VTADISNVTSEHDEEITSLKRAIVQENNMFLLSFNFARHVLCNKNSFFYLFFAAIHSMSPYFPLMSCCKTFDLEKEVR
jgi:hypothetical protein